MRKYCVACAGVLALVVLAASAQASIIVDNWTLNLAGTAGALTTAIEGIDELTFGDAINEVIVSKGAGNVAPFLEVGDTSVVRGLIYIDRFKDTDGTYTGGAGGGNIPVAGYGSTWEVTAKFQANILWTDFDALTGNFSFVHTDGTDTFLKIYVDEFGAGSGGSAANSITGLGFDDGTMILDMQDTVTGFLNPFSPTAEDGSDDATFVVDAARIAAGYSILPGVLFSVDGVNDGVANGVDLASLIPPNGIIVQTDENFDTAEYNAGTRVPPTMWGAGTGPFPGVPTVSPNTPLFFFADGDGSAELGIVPEPASMAIWISLGIVGLVVAAWRRRNVR